MVDIGTDLSARLRERGILIPPGEYNIHPDTELESPCALLGGFDFRRPFRGGAFSYSYSYVSPFVWEMGRYCSIGGGCRFGDMEHPPEWLSTSNFTYDGEFWSFFRGHGAFTPLALPPARKRDGITLGHDVWIGARAYVRAGVTVGTGAIVGHSAVVTKDVPPYAVVIGNPGRIIKYRFPESLIAKLLASQWWNYRYPDFEGMDITQPEAFLEQLEARGLPEYRPEKIRLADFIAGETPALSPVETPSSAPA